MKLGLALFRCGEPQCSNTLSDKSIMEKFHNVIISDNRHPYHSTVNKTLKKCFDGGADWVVMMDGDMTLKPNLFDAIDKGIASGRKCIHLRLWDPYINHDLGTLKVVTREWMEAGEWYKDALVCDRECEIRAKAKGFPRYSSMEIVATHFDDPTQFQIFKRFYIRGMKVASGYGDSIKDYTTKIEGIALQAYRFGFSNPTENDPHDLPELLGAYNRFLNTFDPVICGVCVWGDFPYHCNNIRIGKNDPRHEDRKKQDPNMQALYVNRLAISVGRNMKRPHKMFYLSPRHIDGVIPECQWVKLDSEYKYKNLNKFGMYNEEYLALGDTFITFDLDNVPIGDLSPMVDAVKHSNGFLCRSEMGTLKKNIPGGDMIGYKKETGRFLLKWLIDYIPTHFELKDAGAERLILRRFVEIFPQHSQFWWEFLGSEAILGWKGQLREGHATISDKTLLISAWGDWAIHEIDRSFPQSWTQKWREQYGSQIISTGNKGIDVAVWKICRKVTNHHELYVAALEACYYSAKRIWRDPNGYTLYRRDRGDVVRLEPNASMAHPNSLSAVDTRKA